MLLWAVAIINCFLPRPQGTPAAFFEMCVKVSEVSGLRGNFAFVFDPHLPSTVGRKANSFSRASFPADDLANILGLSLHIWRCARSGKVRDLIVVRPEPV
jgi:hypothetical protein